MSTIPPLIVESRPAVALVTALPAKYELKHSERWVLMALALDSYDGKTAAPSYEALAAWTGLLHGTVGEALKNLVNPNEHRPALLARAEYRRARRTVWQLLLEPSSTAGGDSAVKSPAQPDTTNTAKSPAKSPGKSPGKSPAELEDNPSSPLQTPNPQPDRPAEQMVATAADDSPAAAPRHPREANASSALASLKLPLDTDELLREAYRVGAGDPWAGYVQVKHVAQQDLRGVRDPASVLRSRIRGLAVVAPPSNAQPGDCPRHPYWPAPPLCGKCAEEVSHATAVQ